MTQFTFKESKWWAAVNHLLDLLCRRKKWAAAFPSTSDQIHTGVGVVFSEMLQEVVLEAKDQRAILPLGDTKAHMAWCFNTGAMKQHRKDREELQKTESVSHTAVAVLA